MELKSTRIRSISICAFPAFPGGNEGFFAVAIQSIDENERRIYQQVEIGEADLHRVLMAQKALLRRTEQ